MTKQELLGLYQGLNQLGRLTGVKFSYMVAKNLNSLKPDIEALQKAFEASEEYKVFETARVALVEKYTQKDDKGELKMANNAYILTEETKAEFEKEFEALKAKNQAVWDARQEQMKEYVELLKTEITPTLHKIKLEDVPKDITAQEMNFIYPIIEE